MGGITGVERDGEEILARMSVLLEEMLKLARRSAADGDRDRRALQAELSALRIRLDEAADELEEWSRERVPEPPEEGTGNWVV